MVFFLRYIFMDVYTLDFTTYVMCSIPLTGMQKEVLVGTLLGDASLERAKPTHNTRVRFDQSYPEHESYLQSIYTIFQNLTVGPGPAKRYTKNS